MENFSPVCCNCGGKTHGKPHTSPERLDYFETLLNTNDKQQQNKPRTFDATAGLTRNNVAFNTVTRGTTQKPTQQQQTQRRQNNPPPSLNTKAHHLLPTTTHQIPEPIPAHFQKNDLKLLLQEIHELNRICKNPRTHPSKQQIKAELVSCQTQAPRLNVIFRYTDVFDGLYTKHRRTVTLLLQLELH